MPSNLRASVQWKDTVVFAGEDIECIITFTNIAGLRGRASQELGNVKEQPRPRMERQRTVTQSTGFTRHSLTNVPSVTTARTASHGRSHRPTLSLSVVPNSSHGRTASSAPTTANNTVPPRPSHGRSLSIMSLGSDAQNSPSSRKTSPGVQSKRGRGHGRSASMQIMSRSQNQASPSAGSPAVRQPSPLHEASVSSAMPALLEHAVSDSQADRLMRGATTAPTSPGLPTGQREPSPSLAPEFKFPAEPSSPLNTASSNPSRHLSRSNSGAIPRLNRARSPNIQESWLVNPGNLHPVSRVLSEISVNDSPRSSGDFYSASNDSNETLASEQPYQATNKLLPRSTPSRQSSNHGRTMKTPEPEHLMMGYVQTMGSFSLDGSLVNQAPFEEVKRKGIVGGQGGGGVVGIERSKRESGLFGAFGWGNIGESLGGLLGMDELSSIKEMRNLASMKTIPLLSTPQSVLFVDLRLRPGETKSYLYKFRIPKGLPPSHKGRSIKVQYHLSIGVQRPDKLSQRQDVKHIELPFRVLGSVNDDGETLGHDLMSPYILLDDNARISSVSMPGGTDPFDFELDKVKDAKSPRNGYVDFLSYTDRLLTQTSSSAPLLSPTSPTERRPSAFEAIRPSNMKAKIDFAIMRSNMASSSSSSSSTEVPSQSNNRFTISRAGHHVGVLTILRPAYRLGETVVGKIVFMSPNVVAQTSTSALPASTYTVSMTLESTERIDPSLALRSASSVQRATRKVHAQSTETALFARETSLSLEVPASATPTFETTGVRLAWRIRLEFAIARTLPYTKDSGLGISGDVDGQAVDDAEDLLEEVAADDRAKILIAKERLNAETFEVAVPIRVYGAVGIAADSTAGAQGQEPLEI